jgi:hypothetical protein
MYKRSYSTLGKETNYNCSSNSQCSCKTLYGRTEFDKMMYNWVTNGTGLPSTINDNRNLVANTNIIEFK